MRQSWEKDPPAISKTLRHSHVSNNEVKHEESSFLWQRLQSLSLLEQGQSFDYCEKFPDRHIYKKNHVLLWISEPIIPNNIKKQSQHKTGTWLVLSYKMVETCGKKTGSVRFC